MESFFIAIQEKIDNYRDQSMMIKKHSSAAGVVENHFEEGRAYVYDECASQLQILVDVFRQSIIPDTEQQDLL